MTVRVEVSPTMLRWAVSRAGWDHATTVGRVPQFDDWVERRVLPTLKQLEEFARKTYTPFGHLFLVEPPDERVPIPDMRTLGMSGSNVFRLTSWMLSTCVRIARSGIDPTWRTMMLRLLISSVRLLWMRILMTWRFGFDDCCDLTKNLL